MSAMPNATTGPNADPAPRPPSPRRRRGPSAGSPREADAVRRRGSAGVRTSSTTPPRSVLCTPAAPVFTTTGKPSAAAAARACDSVCATRWAAVGMPYAVEQPQRPRRVEPARRPPPASAAATIAAAAARSTRRRSCTSPDRPAQPLGSLGDAAEHPMRRSPGRRSRAGRARPRPRRPAPRASTVLRAPRGRRGDGGDHLVGIGDRRRGRRGTITASTPGSASTHGMTAANVSGRRRSDEVDRDSHAWPSRAARCAICSRVWLGERRRAQAGVRAGVGAQDAEAAGVCQHGRPAGPRGSGCGREQRRQVEQLLQRRQRAARRPGGTARRRPRRSRRAPRCATGGARAGGGAAALHRDRPASRARPGGRSGRTCAGCRTTPGRAATSAVASSSSQCSSRSFDETSALLPIETNAETPEPARARPPRAAPGPARRSATRRRCARRERTPARRSRSGATPLDGEAEAVRADQPRAVRAHQRQQLAPGARALGARLGEARRDHADRPDAGRERRCGRGDAPPRPARRRRPGRPGRRSRRCRVAGTPADGLARRG